MFNDTKQSWILYYWGWIISTLNKKRRGIFVFFKCHQHQTRSEKIKANKTDQIPKLFSKNWTTTYSTTFNKRCTHVLCRRFGKWRLSAFRRSILENLYHKNCHPNDSLGQIPLEKLLPNKTPTQDNSHPDNFHPG